MKKLLMAALAVVAVACSPKIENKVYNEGINIIPVPVSLTQGEGKFMLTSSTVIVDDGQLAGVSGYLVEKIKAATGYNLAVVASAPQSNFIAFAIDNSISNAEGYTLKSTTQGVSIASSTPTGAFYGMQTLLQLLPAEIESSERINNIEWSLPVVDIEDYPRFAYRGIMLDPCRHFISAEFVKKQIDVLAMYKVNRIHWHLTDDQGWRIEIKKYPKLTELGAVRTEGDGSTYGPFFYTQDEIKDVVAYAAERFIEIIPEIELPGHALAALTGYPQYSCTGGPFTPRIVWGVEEDVFCVGKDATFDFLTDIIDEVVELFPSKYFHIGGDECPKARWKECADCQARAKALGLKEKTDGNGVKHSVEEQLQSYAVARVQKHLTTKGKEIIGWDEILEGGLTDGAIVMSWRGVEGAIAAAKQGNRSIMTPNPKGFYVDYYQGAPEVEPLTIGGNAPIDTVYSFNPVVPNELTPEQQQLIIGIQVNAWSEYMTSETGAEYMIYPRLLALAEVGWSPMEAKDFTKFAKRLANAYVRLDFHNINYHIAMPEGTLTRNVVFTGDSVKVGFVNRSGYPMVYTVDGSEPTAKSSQYADSIVFKDKGTIKIATMLPSGKLSVVRTIAVEKQALKKGDVQPMTGIKVNVAPGLFISKEQYANAKFGADTMVKKLDGSVVYDMKNPSLATYQGTFDVPVDGVYTFGSNMDEVIIDGDLIIDNNSPKVTRHNAHKVQKALAAGTHSYKIVYNNMIKSGWPSVWSEVGFIYQVPGSTEWLKPDAEKEVKK